MNIIQYIDKKYNSGKAFDKCEVDYVYDLIKNIDNTDLFNKYLLLAIKTKGGITTYNKYKNYSTTNINELSEIELLEYIELIFKYLIDYIKIEDINNIISRYLSISTNRKKLNIILNKYSNNKKYKDIKNYIDNDPKNILYKICSCLKGKNIDYSYLNKLVDDYCSFDNNYYDYYINTTVLKEVLSLFEANNNIKNIKYKFLNRVYRLLSEYQINSLIKNDIESGKIIIDSSNSSAHCNITFDSLDIVKGENIISIKDDYYSNIDYAFSINSFDDIYTLNIYISDVPSFLNKNHIVTLEAYKKGSSMYLDIPNKGIYNVDIIPAFLSHKYLSLNEGHTKNVIRFKFILNSKGYVYSKEVSRNRIMVNKTLSIKDADKILNSPNEIGLETITLKKLVHLLIQLNKIICYYII